ncbi:Sec14-like protein [Acrasis kona]|uniref:Sec14-like protein n=1 Tax=Acrasis kona TaxID=1008807 RepID=A0AAW2Z5L3_9EUKA
MSEKDIKAVMQDTKDVDTSNEFGGMIVGETKAPFRDPERGGGQTRIATLKYPWNHVVTAYCSRFPTNDQYFPYIKKTEILEHKEEGDTVSETRRVSIDPGMPGWLKTLTRLHYFTFVEKSFIDYKKKIMKLDTEMESLSTYANVLEDCTYSQDPENPEWTKKEQTAYCKINVWVPFGYQDSIEGYGSWIFTERAKDALRQEKNLIENIIANGGKYTPSNKTDEI